MPLFQIMSRFWLKKLQTLTYIPKADSFFWPLYHTYDGDFKVRDCYAVAEQKRLKVLM